MLFHFVVLATLPSAPHAQDRQVSDEPQDALVEIAGFASKDAGEEVYAWRVCGVAVNHGYDVSILVQ